MGGLGVDFHNRTVCDIFQLGWKEPLCGVYNDLCIYSISDNVSDML